MDLVRSWLVRRVRCRLVKINRWWLVRINRRLVAHLLPRVPDRLPVDAWWPWLTIPQSCLVRNTISLLPIASRWHQRSLNAVVDSRLNRPRPCHWSSVVDTRQWSPTVGGTICSTREVAPVGISCSVGLSVDRIVRSTRWRHLRTSVNGRPQSRVWNMTDAAAAVGKPRGLIRWDVSVRWVLITAR